MKDGLHQLVFLTPENLFHGVGIREMLLTESFQSKVVAFVVDEAHCIKKWGESFRFDYLRLGELRSLIPSNVHVLALTATASKSVLEAAISVLHMDKPVIIAAKPERDNIFLSVTGKKEIIDVVRDIAHSVLSAQEEGPLSFPKTLVFCRR